MMDVLIRVDTGNPVTLMLGRQGENAVTSFAFDCTPWEAVYGGGVASLVVRRYNEAEPYPVALTASEGLYRWVVSAVDTGIAGNGEAQLVYTVDDVVKKTIIYRTIVLSSIEASADPPSPYQSWLDQVIEARDDAEQAVVDAQAQVTLAEAEAERAERAASAAEDVFSFTADNDGNITIARSV